jgi:hypothetical protein
MRHISAGNFYVGIFKFEWLDKIRHADVRPFAFCQKLEEPLRFTYDTLYSSPCEFCIKIYVEQ